MPAEGVCESAIFTIKYNSPCQGSGVDSGPGQHKFSSKKNKKELLAKFEPNIEIWPAFY